MRSGKAMVKIMQRTGIDHIISSPGSEWPPVWEALAELAAERGLPAPTDGAVRDAIAESLGAA